MIRPLSVLLVTTALLPSPASAADEAMWPEWVEQSRQLSMQLGKELKAELGAAIEKGGPVAAIDVCRTRAPAIAARLSGESGARVGRTALRVRNAANAPDDLERAVLEQFAGELASGRVEGPLEAAFEIKRDAGIERHYLRGIPTEALCLTCHGETLAPELAAAIAREYPGDQATGFKLGELRGAFRVVWPAASGPATR
jgi:Protein of unknown function (DUF3365)